MINVKLTKKQVESEVDRIIGFIDEKLGNCKKVVIGVSGGLDSDVVARLTKNVPSIEKIKLVFVIQEGLEEKYFLNAMNLANDLQLKLIKIDLRDVPKRIIQSMKTADPEERFLPEGLLDISRAKCSIRTPVFSTYQDRGYVVIGPSNRTEIELGFFLPFGDGLAHIKPIAHLYKTQVFQIAEYLGTRPKVINQPPSSGFWEGANDLEDISYWLFHESPIQKEIDFDKKTVTEVERIKDTLNFERLDKALMGISSGLETRSIEKESGLPRDIVIRINNLRNAAKSFKSREINAKIINGELAN